MPEPPMMPSTARAIAPRLSRLPRFACDIRGKRRPRQGLPRALAAIVVFNIDTRLSSGAGASSSGSRPLAGDPHDQSTAWLPHRRRADDRRHRGAGADRPEIWLRRLAATAAADADADLLH